MTHDCPRSLRSGQTLVSVLIGLAIFLILSSAVFTLVQGSFQVISFNRSRIAARHLAQEKIEFIRNLTYDDVGTLGGIPSGPLEQEEVVERNGLSYTVKTDIIYIDDPFDNVIPSDLLPSDYKRVRVEVSWGGTASSRRNPVVLVTDITPRGVETTAGGGTLSIFVIDANGQPVPQADVQITANTTPFVNLSLSTSDNGRVILPGAPTCTACYQVSITKSGFSTDRTYATTEVANPVNPHLSILTGELTEVTLSIDRLSTLTFQTMANRASGFLPLGNISFRLRGTKIIGTETDGTSVYKYDETLSTNSLGLLTVNDLEWDSYEVSMSQASSFDISGIFPKSPMSIEPDTQVDVKLATEAKSQHSLLLTFMDPSQVHIASVSATLTGANPDTIYSGQTGTPDFGQAFFSNLSSATYQLTATASGYLDYTGTVPVIGTTQETILLTPQ